MQNHLQQGFMYPDAPVVFNEAKIAKAIHEETDSGPCCADHSREGLLRNLGNECFRTAIIAEFAHEQKNPGQTLFTGVEELIDQIGLKTHAASKRNFMKRSENSCSSCTTRIISSRVILRAVHAVMAVAEARRSLGIAASASSPTKACGARSAIVASLPVLETTETFARPF